MTHARAEVKISERRMIFVFYPWTIFVNNDIILQIYKSES